jgi:hypothetical protein
MTMGCPSQPKSLRESLRLWESNVISTVPGDPNPQARLSESMDFSRDTCLNWLRKLTSPAKITALIVLRNTPNKMGLTIFEVLYGRTFLQKDLILDLEVTNLVSHITQLAKFQQVLWSRERRASRPLPVTFHPGNLVLIKLPHNSWDLSESLWKGPYPILLSTPTGIKVAGLDSWNRILQVKHWTPEPDALTAVSHPYPPAYSCEQ